MPGTKRIKDIVAEATGSHPSGFFWVPPRGLAGGTVYFTADDGSHGFELWKWVP